MDRARRFGQVAESYDRFRPGYPKDVYVTVVRPGELVLEAGAGTGIATEGLASRARRVDAIEPDAAMAAIARRRTTGLAVTVQESSFEECEAGDSAYDVVACAQAWHWIDLDRGYPRAARALRPGGRLAVWWNRPGEPSGRIWDAIQSAYATHAPELQRPPNEAKQRHREDNFPEGPGFGAWTLTRWSWTRCYDAAAYRGYLSTHSDHLALPDDRREALLTAASRAIGRARFEHPYYTVLAVAHKTS